MPKLSAPPLSLYLHFPWCVRKCPYCDFNSHALRGTLDEMSYVAALVRDLEFELATAPEARARAALATARASGFDNVNLDLMFALPEQTLAQATADLAALLALEPEHV